MTINPESKTYLRRFDESYKEEQRARSKKWYASLTPQQKKELYLKRRERIVAGKYGREWDKNNPEKTREYRAKWRETNREKILAEQAVARALRSGDLVRQPCEICGGEKSHAHHDDYSKPLSVRWLCQTHHMNLHRKHLDYSAIQSLDSR